MEIDINDIDFDSLRDDLRDYYGAAVSSSPFAMADVVNVDSASDIDLLNIINNTSLDIRNYIKGDYTNRM